MLNENDKIGGYKIVKLLGEGQFGEVYKVEWEKKGKLKFGALKILKKSENQSLIEEISNWALASNNKNIVTFYGAKDYQDKILLVSECVEEGNLENWLSVNKTPTKKQCFEMIFGILNGVGHLHENEIIHRDLKPANILIRDEIPLLADFGMARSLALLNSSKFGGSPIYMPPEIFESILNSKPIPERNELFDLWAIPLILHQLLYGFHPFGFIKSQEDLLKNPDLSTEIPQELKEFFNKSLNRNPSLRYQCANEMRLALESWGNSFSQAETIRNESASFDQNAPAEIPPTPIAEKLLPTKGFEEVKRQEEAEAKRRQVDIDNIQLGLDKKRQQNKKTISPIILFGCVGLIVLIGAILGSVILYNSLSSNSAKVVITNANINKISNISTNSNVSISNVNTVNTEPNPTVTPTVTPKTSPTSTPTIEIKATPTITPKTTFTPTPEIKPTQKVEEETSIVVSTPRPTPRTVIVSTPRPTPKLPKIKDTSDNCIYNGICNN
jgi:serine/threonine protein kinase